MKTTGERTQKSCFIEDFRKKTTSGNVRLRTKMQGGLDAGEKAAGGRAGSSSDGGVFRLQGIERGAHVRKGGSRLRGFALDAQFDMPARLCIAHAGQAEHLD